ncbi:MAG: UbiD family decarboxylase [Desulfamplus sp.]|nr:UbiD family decarboxylase [Desulfamplus sp.]
MIFKSLMECVNFLEREGELVRITLPMDPDLEMAEVHNRVFQAGGPAVLFEKVKGTPFPALSNLFGTRERALKILEPQLEKVTALVNLKSMPGEMFKSPVKSARALMNALHALPLKRSSGPVMQSRCSIKDLPMIRCWPDDGGAFIYLPQVFSRDPAGPLKKAVPGILSHSNLGMYRIQLSGNDYVMNREVGVHYQLHRGIGNHHARALELNIPLPVSIFVGGPPAHTLAAVMPLPEGMPEVAFAGVLAGRSFRYSAREDGIISLDSDFCITGKIYPGKTKPEGPFGDHLGYYSLTHEFPFMEVERVYHRKDAIWPFTVVGRPPREDSVLGGLIHEITASAIPDTIAGVTAIHAVDAAGVHPLLFATALERYVPFENKKPRELLTHANAILGTGQLSLAKYLIIASHNDSPNIDIHDEMGFIMHVLERIDFQCDLHFHTCTTMDTLDYSSQGLNQGSKVVFVCAGDKRRELLRYIPSQVAMAVKAPFSHPRLAAPGIMVIQGPPFESYSRAPKEMNELTNSSLYPGAMEGLPLVVVVDDSHAAAQDFSTFLWTAFSRSNPSHDIYGMESFTHFKHWGCRGSLVIDARIKPFHAPPLVQDTEIVRRVNKLGERGGPLYGFI